MSEIMEYLREFNWVTIIIRLVLSLIIAGVIGYERERRGRAAGFRTHIIVCLGACLATLTGVYACKTLQLDTDPLRLGAQVLSGIGFLGVGTILITGRMHVRGLTTAAGLWTTAAIGLAFGIGFYEGAVICAALVFIACALMNVNIGKTGSYDIYMEIDDISFVNSVIQSIKAAGYDLKHIEIKKASSEKQNCVGVIGSVVCQKNGDICNILADISAAEHVMFAIESL